MNTKYESPSECVPIGHNFIWGAVNDRLSSLTFESKLN